MTDPRVILAARENAAWCDLVCNALGRSTSMALDAWSCDQRSPDGYPDAVTVRPGVARDGRLGLLLDRIEAGAGASIKDSFADLPLERHGYEILFEATWIHRPPGATSAQSATVDEPSWRPVIEPAELAAWVAANDVPALGQAGLLNHPALTVLGAFAADRLVAGAIFHRIKGAVGLSNVFTAEGSVGATFRGAADFAARLEPELPLVGYEHGHDLAAALAARFEEIGSLRVWMAP